MRARAHAGPEVSGEEAEEGMVEKEEMGRREELGRHSLDELCALDEG